MIGVFDSGFGGLTVLKELLSLLPEYDYVYLGDNARAPYGGRSDETVYKYTRQAVDFLFAQGCGIIIIACNTASAVALRRLQKEYLPKYCPQKRILGVVRPLAEAAAKEIDLKVGVVGTKSTILSNIYEKEINFLNRQVKVFQQACPLLVPMIEEGWMKSKEIKSVLRYYLKPLKKAKINKLILGCTHYPLILDLFKKEIHKGCQVYDCGKIVAESMKDYLQRHEEIDKLLAKNKKRTYLTTDSVERFSSFAHLILKNEKVFASKVDLS